jgi:hypothetical protein
MNHCEPAAYVLGPGRQLPDDPTDYDWENRHPPVGCNRLVCPRCKADVKVTSEEPKRRVYACECFEHSASTGCMTFELHFTQFGDPEPQHNLPWNCGGHPPAELPLRFGDRTIRERAELVAAIVAAAKDVAQHDALLSVHHRTQSGPLEGIVPDALARAAAGPSPIDESLKAFFMKRTRLAPLASFAKQVARGSRERRLQLVDVLAQSVWYLQPDAAKGTIAVLRREALKGVITSAQLAALSWHDYDWMLAHFEELLKKNPEHAGRILAWGGRVFLMAGSFTEEASQGLEALARKTGVSVDTLIAQAEESSGIWAMETRAAIKVLERMRPR